MSRAFVKEQDGEPLAHEALDLPQSPHPNLVTPSGLKQLEARLAAFEDERARLHAEERMEDRPHLERVDREIRYHKARLETAQLIDLHEQPRDRVAFGATVTVEDGEGKQHDYRIVGEDEADPEKGLVSYVSPLARALADGKVGDLVTWRRPAGDLELEIVAISYS
jgi:transcription elongation GreA/GreB family factor